MDTIFYGNAVATWLYAALATVAVTAALLLTRRIMGRRLAAFSRNTNNDVDDLIVDLVRGTRSWFLAGAALLVAAQMLVLAEPAMRLLGRAAVIGAIIQGALWGNLLIAHVVRTQTQRRIESDAASATTINALGLLGRLLLWSVLVLVGLDNLGVDVTALVAGLGVGGVAVALAVQNILGDLFASLSIVLDKPFVNGDFIVVGDMAGSVEHIGLKTTRIRSLQGEQIVFSNNDLLGSRIRNYKRMQERRIAFTLGVTYDTAPEKVVGIPLIIRGIIETLPGVRFDRAHFKSYGAFSLDFEVVYYVLDADYNRYMDLQQAINLAILHRFAAEGIQFALPTQTLQVNMARGSAGPESVRLS